MTRKAVGTIIGGAFLLLIFSSMISTFFFIENSNRLTSEAYLERIDFDNKKLKEEIKYLKVTRKNNDYLNITVRNTGNVGTQIVYVGEINETSPEKEEFYHRVNLYLNPLEAATDISSNFISIEENQSKTILLLTSYGNMYYYPYIEQQDNGTGNPEINYNLTISVSGNGTTTPAVGTHTYSEGTDVNVTSFPGVGWDFNYWLLDGSPFGFTNPITVTMDDNHSLEAVFTQGILILLEDYFGSFDNWENTNWEIQSDHYHSAGSSARSDSNNEHSLQSLTLNTSDASSLTISFWYRLTGGVEPTDVSIEIYDGQGGPDNIGYLTGLEDTWLYYNYTTTDLQYFIPDFYISFDSNLAQSEMVWIDDLKITITP